MLEIVLLLLINVLDVNGRFQRGCGLNNIVVNRNTNHGENVVPHSWPMIVSIHYNYNHQGNFQRHNCSGTILSESLILTSVRCVQNIDASMLEAGIVSIVTDVQDDIFRTVDQVFLHPNWTNNPVGMINDLAILHVSQPFDLTTNQFLAPTCLQSQRDSMEFSRDRPLLTVVGWNQFSRSRKLRQATVNSLPSNDLICSKSIQDRKRQFCAGLPSDRQSLCDGDMGGPIFRWIGDHWEQVGIISYGLFGCPSDGYQSVFTRITPYYNWIESIVNAKEMSIKRLIGNKLLSNSVSQPPPPRTLYRCDHRSLSCGCGYSQVELTSSKFFAGEEALPFSWPMMVSVRVNNSDQHACGGSILNENFILTAASCVVDAPKTSPTGVAVGIVFYELSEGGIGIIAIDQIFLHSKYVGVSDGYQNDIAILHLSEPISFENSELLKRTCVPYPNADVDKLQYPPTGTPLAVIGWGLTPPGMTNLSDALQQAEIVVINSNEPKCQASIRDSATQFCAGLYDQGRDTCKGDSGGPILQWKGKSWEQVGITSYRKDCGSQNQPIVYTRLVQYVDWIERTINSSLTTTTQKPPVTNPPVTYTCDKSVPCGCGYNNVILPPSRIVGGYDAISHSWPMVVSLRNMSNDRFFCGGSILSDSFILTAAHCVIDREVPGPDGIKILAGNDKQSDLSAIVREVDSIHIHPEWVPGQLGNWNDIAILHLSQPLNISTNPFLSRICLPQPNTTLNMLNYPLNGTRLAVIGWGAIEEGYYYSPDDLQQTEIFVMHKNDQICDRTIRDKARQFCAGLYEGGKDSCQGDSGGPALVWKENRWEQIGIVSYGMGCANPNYPGVYTQVLNYVDWIESVIKESPTTSKATKFDQNKVFMFILFLCFIGK